MTVCVLCDMSTILSYMKASKQESNTDQVPRCVCTYCSLAGGQTSNHCLFEQVCVCLQAATNPAGANSVLVYSVSVMQVAEQSCSENSIVVCKDTYTMQSIQTSQQ